MAVHEAPPAVHLAADQPANVEMVRPDAAQLQRRQVSHQQGAHGAGVELFARRDARADCRDRHRI